MNKYEKKDCLCCVTSAVDSTLEVPQSLCQNFLVKLLVLKLFKFNLIDYSRSFKLCITNGTELPALVDVM